MTNESLKRGQEIQNEIGRLKSNRSQLSNEIPVALITLGYSTRFTDEEIPELAGFIGSVIERISKDILTLEEEFKAL